MSCAVTNAGLMTGSHSCLPTSPVRPAPLAPPPGAWQQFQSRAAAAADLDALLSAHRTYLSSVLSKALLDEESALARDTLAALLANMLDLPPVVAGLVEEVRGCLQGLAAGGGGARLSSGFSGWGR